MTSFLLSFATTAQVVGVLPATTYTVTVHNSDPASFTTDSATLPPDAQTGVHTWWTRSSTADRLDRLGARQQPCG